MRRPSSPAPGFHPTGARVAVTPSSTDSRGEKNVTIVVTNETGGTAQPTEAMYVPPDRQVHDAGSTTVLAEAGLDAAFVADLLSACLAHERCGVHLYRSVAGRTADAELRAQYEHFGAETLEHVERLEELIAAADGDPQYVSASARATEKAGAGCAGVHLPAGRIGGRDDRRAGDARGGDAGRGQGSRQLGAARPAGRGDDRLATCAGACRPSPTRCSPRRRSTTRWAHDTRARMLLSLADAGSVATVPHRTRRRGTSRTRDELYAQAQELDIQGRSQMTKDELRAPSRRSERTAA